MFPPVLPAISIFGKIHQAYDVTSSTANHRQTGTPGADYDVFGPIQPARPKDLEILPEGDRTSAAVTLHTKSELFIADAGTDKQTFIKYQGKVWRVAAVGDWDAQGFRRYVATSYSVR
jgi:hypothetical protein